MSFFGPILCNFETLSKIDRRIQTTNSTSNLKFEFDVLGQIPNYFKSNSKFVRAYFLPASCIKQKKDQELCAVWFKSSFEIGSKKRDKRLVWNILETSS